MAPEAFHLDAASADSRRCTNFRLLRSQRLASYRLGLGQDPYGGGWHFWRPGIKVWETLPCVRQPIASMPVHICGESYTNQQGWVEGALTSAEHVVQKYFKLRTPAWLQPQDYFMGP